MNRRAFIGSVAAAALVPSRALALLLPAIPVLYGDGKHDDAAALNAWFAGKRVQWSDGSYVGASLEHRTFMVKSTVTVPADCPRKSFSYNHVTIYEYVRHGA